MTGMGPPSTSTTVRVARRAARMLVACAASAGWVVTPIGAPSGRAPSGGGTRLVAVMAYHLHHEAELAALAVSRATSGSDPGFAALARQVATQADAAAAQLDGQLRRWAISAAEAAALRSEAADPVTAVVGAGGHLACSVQGPVTDLDQLRAADAAQVTSVFAASELTDAVEGARLAETARPTLDPGTRHLADGSIDWHRSTIRRLAPYLISTDRAYAATFDG